MKAPSAGDLLPRLLVTALAQAIFFSACSREPTPPAPSANNALEQAIEKVRTDYDLPAVAAAFIDLDGFSEVAVSGRSRLDGEAGVSSLDLWHLGSVTKPMTATLAAILVEKGEISWDATVAAALGSRVEAIDPALRDIRLHQLLRHRAGIQAFEEDEEWNGVPELIGEPHEQRAQFVTWLLGRPPMHPPGEAHVYSNAGYGIAAAMLESATGRTWEELMAQELFAPLGIDHFAFGWPALKDDKQPWGHWLVDGELAVHENLTGYSLAGQGVGPAGDVAMSVAGLARFALLHLRGLDGEDDLLSAETIRYLHTVDPPDEDDPYALGWNSFPTRSSHVGSAGTFFAAIYLRKEERVAWLIASNASTPDDTGYGRDLLVAVRDRWRAASEPSAGSAAVRRR